jgi:hypothetical protein
MIMLVQNIVQNIIIIVKTVELIYVINAIIIIVIIVLLNFFLMMNSLKILNKNFLEYKKIWKLFPKK